VIKIDKNKKGVAMFDRAQWFLASMSIALSVQLNQPVAAAVPVGKVVQTAQTNSSDAAETALKEGVQLYQQGMAQAQRSAILKFEQALKLYREAGDRRGEATTLTWIGLVYAELGKNQKALEYYNQTLPLWRALGDHHREASTLYTTAYFNRDQNNLTEALNDIESAIKILENLRPTAPSPEVCSSYLATMQENYEVYIDLLMQLHQANPNSGYDVKALEARKRAINP
jgi:tetratricopeptide (TPR) repeat protein